MPGDFAIMDLDSDGDKDWVGTSMTLGKAFIVEQVQPPASLITTIALPDDFTGTIGKFNISVSANKREVEANQPVSGAGTTRHR